jgi:hypothetical protein
MMLTEVTEDREQHQHGDTEAPIFGGVFQLLRHKNRVSAPPC